MGVLARATSRSHLGRVLVGLRDAESRTRFLGCRVEHDKLVVWIVSAMMADALVGAALGAMTVALAGPLLTGWLPDAWIYALGALFILLMRYLPGGILNGLKLAREAWEAVA
ncbi:MAG: hypothetical protein U1E41_03565 [Paracoccus sp. (in: a-proteobacteria)]